MIEEVVREVLKKFFDHVFYGNVLLMKLIKERLVDVIFQYFLNSRLWTKWPLRLTIKSI